MTRKLVLVTFTSLLLLISEAGFARVAGLPDFTELVEKTGPAVVNIQVTQFGERALGGPDGMDGAQGQEEIPEFFSGPTACGARRRKRLRVTRVTAPPGLEAATDAMPAR